MTSPYHWQVDIESTRKRGESHLCITVRLIDPELGLDPFVEIPSGRETFGVPQDLSSIVNRMETFLSNYAVEGLSHHIPKTLRQPYHNILHGILKVRALPKVARRTESLLATGLQAICSASSTPLYPSKS